MIPPISIKFDDIEIPTSSITRTLSNKAPCPASWLRVQFPIPDPWDAPTKVEEWLNENCPNGWRSYHYQNPKNQSSEHIMVVRFEDKNDAIFFKLRGGHQAWEQQ